MAAAATFKFLLALFLVLMAKGAVGYCGPNSLTINQVKTGDVEQNKPIWKTTITNECICTLDNIMLSCPGFGSVKAIDPHVLSISGDICTVNNNEPLYKDSSYSFTYAWDQPFPFKVYSVNVFCS